MMLLQFESQKLEREFNKINHAADTASQTELMKTMTENFLSNKLLPSPSQKQRRIGLTSG